MAQTSLTIEQKIKLYKDQIDYLCTLSKNYDHKLESKVQAMITDSLNNHIFSMQKAIALEITGKEY